MITPTKKRLTIIFTSIIIILNICMLAASYIFLDRVIMTGIKRHMMEDIESEFVDQFRRSGLDPFKNMWDEHRFQILNKEGVVVVSTRNSVDFYPSLNRGLLEGAFSGRQGFETLPVGREPHLISYFPLDGNYIGRVATSLSEEMKYERAFLRLIFVTFPAILLLSYLLSRYLVNHAMKPISNVFTFQETFSSNVSHELRSPLASLKGNFEVSLRKERTPEEYRAVISSGLKEIDRIIDLLKNLSLLASSKFKPLDLFKKEADIGSVVRELITLYTPLSQARRITLEVTEIPEAACLCDKGLIRRSIENLIDNAIKYSPEGGTISIAVAKKAGKVLLTVENTCKPVSRDELRHLFDPFYRGRSSVQTNADGKGLGLYISRYIVRSHGGDIIINATGSDRFSVTVSLPVK